MRLLLKVLAIAVALAALCLAGLARMRVRRFAAALALGTVPTAALFAWLGHVSRDEPWYGMAVAVAVPLVIWPVFLRVMGRRTRRSGSQG